MNEMINETTTGFLNKTPFSISQTPEARLQELETLVADFARGPRGMNGLGLYETDVIFAERVRRTCRRVAREPHLP